MCVRGQGCQAGLVSGRIFSLGDLGFLYVDLGFPGCPLRRQPARGCPLLQVGPAPIVGAGLARLRWRVGFVCFAAVSAPPRCRS